MKRKEILIIHGLNGSPSEHWQAKLYEELKEDKEKVFFPQFPNNDKPNLNNWLSYLKKFERHIHEDTIVIAHSMGAILWLHYIKENPNKKVKKVVLVAPPSRDFLLSSSNTNSFSNFNLDKELLHSTSSDSLLIATTNDEYCKDTAYKEFGIPLGINYLELEPEARHINVNSGYGKWDYIYRLAVNS